PLAEPVPVVRRRDPLLPRRAARQGRVRHPLPADARRPADDGARRRTALEAALHPARPRCLAGPPVTGEETDGPAESADERTARRRLERARTIAYLDLEEGRGPVPVLDDEGIAAVLRSTRRIAVVGASSNPGRPSFGVFRYLVHQGYECVPV